MFERPAPGPAVVRAIGVIVERLAVEPSCRAVEFRT